MKRILQLMPLFCLIGCTNQVLSPEEAASEEYLNELNVENTEPDVVNVPGGSVLTIPEVGETNLGFPDGDDAITMPCVCEWEAWRTTNGLMCVGVVCSDSCPQRVVECNEIRRACVVAH